MSDKIDERELEQLENELIPRLSSYMKKYPSQVESTALIQSLQPVFDRVHHAVKPSVIKQCFLQMHQYR